ncbi:hypothetical protein [Adhaeribacter rhizoryzae]|uniref:Uncharacterized protein n=1 Tax=Adhaeribacter rhizoryzae TaxID=2607907 RepID=A0A5M6D5Q0_9BACT|nr:hypothetical protein [Adhaeribacter rhizoryzae]KAA5541642.1 hypothetical protein F0145_20750 [Adhaeribacter rhizoryzae]
MDFVQHNWEDFVKYYNNKFIKPLVDYRKADALLKIHSTMSGWHLVLDLVTWLSILAIPLSIILLFFTIWWLPFVVIPISFVCMTSIRKKVIRTVITTSLNNPHFYYDAVDSGTLRLIIAIEPQKI